MLPLLAIRTRTGPISVRPVTESDIPRIVEIGKENFPESNVSESGVVRRLSKGHLVFVAELGGKLAGFIDLKLGLTGALISGLATGRGFRGKGIGTALLEHAVSFARKKGKLEVELRVAARNLRALNLYKKHGFVVLGRKTRKDGRVVYRMARPFET